ncbi:hypothetical protein F4859DRAFT_522848 [Xylaria cf. heliscus]|nr:hypothetical protein F4859DRAFT_522848 [Xylaria cf. heliscus]
MAQPALIYITFWDNESLAGHRPRPDTLYCQFGGVLLKDISCIVENYKTDFAPLFASGPMKALPESVRTPRPTHTGSSHGLSLYEILNTEGKPIDYYFLENFHRTNRGNAQKIKDILNAPSSPGEQEGREWWCPSIVVRLQEVEDVMGSLDLRKDSDEPRKRHTFNQFFGFLASRRVRLQDYLILINHKDKDEHVHREYDRLEKKDKPLHNYKLMQAIKSYDVDGKLPSDITFADIKDFDEDQLTWAKKVEECMRAWDYSALNPPRAFFVRWKTNQELEEEVKQPNKRFHSGVPATLKEEMRRQPVLGFIERLKEHTRSSRK